MPAATPEDLFARLDALGIAHSTVWHRPVFTVEEGADLKALMPGTHTKNLFVKDKKGALFLISAASETKIDLNALSKLLGAGRFSFGSAELLQEALGVTPGSVTLYAVMNDAEGRVRLVCDEALFAHDPVNFHPLTNTGTTATRGEDLLRFAEAAGHPALRVAFAADGAPSLIEPEPPNVHFSG